MAQVPKPSTDNEGPSESILAFERDCKAAGVAPPAVLKAAGIHPNNWWKWRKGSFSPQLRNFEAAQRVLAEMRQADAA